MKQKQYTILQQEITKVLGRLNPYITSEYGKQEILKIKQDYDIEPPYLTLREYLMKNSYGSYHTFHFTLKDKKISICGLSSMLTDELCTLYPLTKEFYVVKDESKSNGGNVENYHCDHHLTLEPKED